MRVSGWLTVAGLGLLAAGGLAVAAPAPVPGTDPIGDVLARQAEPQPAPEPEAVVIQPPAPLAETVVAETPALTVVEEEEEPETITPPPAGPPQPRVRRQVAVIHALDKVRGESIRFEAPVGEQRSWRGLVFRVRACETTAADEPMPDSMAYLEVTAQPRTREGRTAGRRVFNGWMFASAPALNPIEHPLYDVWVVSCQAAAPSVAGESR